MVTGHYIDSVSTPSGRELRTPADLARDQSYFLFATTQEQVNFLRFPLGRLTKTETRAVATELGLMVAEKPDSQDICFVPDGRYSDLILKLRPDAAEAGDIVHIDGRVLGRHEGILHYTIGQRRGLGVAEGEPLYVIKLDAAAKRVFVGPREALKQTDIAVKDMNWLGGKPIDEYAQPCFVRIRSTRPPVAASIRRHAEDVIVSIPAG